MLNQSKSNAPIIVYALFIFGLLPFVYLNTTCDPETLPRCIVIASLSILYLSYYLVKAKKSNLSVLKHPALICFLLYCILAAFSLYKAVNLGDGLFDLLKIFLYFIFLLLTYLLLKEESNSGPDILVKCINVAVFIFSIYGIVQLIVSYNEAIDFHLKFRIGQNIHSTLANKNIYSEVLLLSLPFVVYGGILFRGPRRLFCFFNTAIILISLIVLMNIYVWMALVASMIFLVGIVFKERKAMLAGSQKLIRLLIIGGIGVVIIAVAAFVKFSNLKQINSKVNHALSYFSDPENINRLDPAKDDNNIHERILLVKNTWQMIKEYSFTGAGLSNWKIYCPKYGVVSYTYHVRVDYPHNDYLSILAEIGMAGLICYVLFLIFLMQCALKVAKSGVTEEDKWLGALLFCGIVSFSLISFFGFSKEKIFPMLLLMCIAALTLFKYSELNNGGKDLSTNLKRLIIGLLIFISGFAIFVGWKRVVAEMHLQRALKAQQLQLWEEVILETEKARTCFYPIDFSATPIDWYEGLAFFYLRDEKMALQNFLKAEKKNPYHAHLLNDIGTCYENKNDQKHSIEYFERAFQLNAPLARKNLVAAYFNAGYLDKAFDLSCSDKFSKPVFLPQLLKAKTLRLAAQQNDPVLKVQIEAKAAEPDELVRIYEGTKVSGRTFDGALMDVLKKN